MGDTKEKRLIVLIVGIVLTLIIYATKLGGDQYIFITDFLAVIFSLVAVIIGIYAVRIYTLKSLQGKALFFIVLGVSIWFLVELSWLFFFQAIFVYAEIFRFIGYLPLILGFFIVSSISDPSLRKKMKKIIYLFIIFIVFAIVYLNIIPVIFGSTSLVENILNNGYIVADFEDNIKEATINFNVDKTWIINNNIDKSTILLNRYANDIWNELVTEEKSRTNN